MRLKIFERESGGDDKPPELPLRFISAEMEGPRTAWGRNNAAKHAHSQHDRERGV